MISPLRIASVSGVAASSAICLHSRITSVAIPLAGDELDRLPIFRHHVDRAARAPERPHTLAHDRRPDLPRRRRGGKRFRDRLELARLLLSMTARRLLDRKPRLVGESSHHGDHGRHRLGNHALPLQRQDPLELRADHDRDPQRREQAESHRVPLRLAARPLLRVRDEHRPEGAHFLDQAREVGEVDPRPGRDHVARRIAPTDLQLLVRRPGVQI